MLPDRRDQDQAIWLTTPQINIQSQIGRRNRFCPKPVLKEDRRNCFKISIFGRLWGEGKMAGNIYVLS